MPKKVRRPRYISRSLLEKRVGEHRNANKWWWLVYSHHCFPSSTSLLQTLDCFLYWISLPCLGPLPLLFQFCPNSLTLPCPVLPETHSPFPGPSPAPCPVLLATVPAHPVITHLALHPPPRERGGARHGKFPIDCAAIRNRAQVRWASRRTTLPQLLGCLVNSPTKTSSIGVQWGVDRTGQHQLKVEAVGSSPPYQSHFRWLAMACGSWNKVVTKPSRYRKDILSQGLIKTRAQFQVLYVLFSN